MGVFTAKDFVGIQQSLKNSVNKPAEVSGVVYELVGMENPTAPAGNAISHVQFPNEDKPRAIKLKDRVFLFTKESLKEQRLICEVLTANGFREFLTTKEGAKKPEAPAPDPEKVFTLRHPEFQEMEGKKVFTVGDAEYSMNDGIIRTEKKGVKNALIKTGFELVDEKDAE